MKISRPDIQSASPMMLRLSLIDARQVPVAGTLVVGTRRIAAFNRPFYVTRISSTMRWDHNAASTYFDQSIDKAAKGYYDLYALQFANAAQGSEGHNIMFGFYIWRTTANITTAILGPTEPDPNIGSIIFDGQPTSYFLPGLIEVPANRSVELRMEYRAETFLNAGLIGEYIQVIPEIVLHGFLA